LASVHHLHSISDAQKPFIRRPVKRKWTSVSAGTQHAPSWTEIDRRDSNSDLNGKDITRTFVVLHHEVGRFVRLVNIGRNHFNSDMLCISSFELFGSLIERE
jgi:hypothetical protein